MLANERESTDERIIRLAQNGQRKDACHELVKAYGNEIVGTCIGRMGCRATGEDAAQDVMARALVALPNFRGERGLRPWLHRIASNRCIDLIRSRQSRLIRTTEAVLLDELPAPATLMPVEQLEAEQERQRQLIVIRDVLTHIKEPDRTWLELHYTHGVGYDEIAEQAELSRAAVKQRIWRAVKRVRSLLEKKGDSIQ